MITDLFPSRREFVVAGGLTAAAVLLAPRRAWAGLGPDDDAGIVARMRKQAGTAKITAQPLRAGLTMLSGAGGNIVVLSGPEGKLLVDAGLASASAQVREALAATGSEPIKYLINTHWHFDHTDGNDWVHGAGATIVAHEKCRTRLAASTRVEGWNFTFEPRDPGALPAVVFGTALGLHVNGMSLSLRTFDPAHTDTDVSVEFVEADVVHVGDVWWNGHYPFIDYSTGGSIDGTIRAVETCLGRVGPKTIIVPGHGPVGDKAQLGEFYTMLSTVRERVAALKKSGKSLAETIAAKPTREFDAKFGHFLMAPADFTGLVYAGV